ncbi:MAG: hypothetical protein ACRYGP_16665 [Janthinobacterium lividum]|jgi:hypothetical protein|nr:hypothetical protein [Lichenibacterium sp. 6Y81]
MTRIVRQAALAALALSLAACATTPPPPPPVLPAPPKMRPDAKTTLENHM